MDLKAQLKTSRELGDLRSRLDGTIYSYTDGKIEIEGISMDYSTDFKTALKAKHNTIVAAIRAKANELQTI